MKNNLPLLIAFLVCLLFYKKSSNDSTTANQLEEVNLHVLSTFNFDSINYPKVKGCVLRIPYSSCQKCSRDILEYLKINNFLLDSIIILLTLPTYKIYSEVKAFYNLNNSYFLQRRDLLSNHDRKGLPYIFYVGKKYEVNKVRQIIAPREIQTYVETN